MKATAQMVLLCSWRTVKEVSLLLGKLSDCCPILPDPEGLLNEDQILAIGVHLTTLLEETKHRGAFEQAYVGFGLLASRLWRYGTYFEIGRGKKGFVIFPILQWLLFYFQEFSEEFTGTSPKMVK